MVLSIAVILSSLSLLSVFLPTVSGLYCACHDEDSDSVNGCGVSYCDHTLSLPHDPAHQSCITVASLIQGEFIIRVCF